MEKEKSSRRHRDSDSHKDRESSKDHHKHHHHRSKHRDGEDDRHRSDEHHNHKRREHSIDFEKSIDHIYEREGSRDRENRHRREKSYENERSYEREDSVERKLSEKRKVRGESEERNSRRGDVKRAKVSEENGRRSRRFEDNKVKEEEHSEYAKERKEESSCGREDQLIDIGQSNGTGPIATGDATGLLAMPSSTVPDTSGDHSHYSATKVSSISTTNENKGVNISRSHEVPDKLSTDGTASDAGKSGGLSLGALAKAKRALQMQKELAERMKKIPLLNKTAGSTREGSSQMGQKEAATDPPSSKGILSMPVASATAPGSTGMKPSTTTLPAVASASVNPQPSGLPHLTGLTTQKYEAVKRAQELAAKMGFRQDPEFAPLINMFPGQMPPDVTMQPKPAKAPVLRLDALGREVDEHGNVVNVPKVNNLSTLKVNINKQKKDAFQILKPELEVDPEKNPHFDARMGIDKTKLLRPKRMTFQFVEEGKWSKDAEIIKLKSQFGEAKAKELKVKQSQLAKAKAEPVMNPNLIEVGERIITKEKQKDPIPEVEWWDVPFLQHSNYGDVADGTVTEDKLKMEKITIYVEHPRPIEPPAEAAPPPPQPLKLTKKEQKKLRTQRRLAREKDRQEMIRLGVVEPPKPKVKMSNLMKVLGSEATQDPTKLEMEIRSAAAEREQAHIDRNIARKLTPAERREKKERKLFDDQSIVETIVSVYKINDLSHPQARFKVDINAQENRLTGCAVISEGINVVVVEGGAKSIKRYGKLMLRRIDWTATFEKEEENENDDEDKPMNKCVLVWQGSVAKPNFNRFFVQDCRTEAAAYKFFSDHGVAHYWDLAVNFTEDQV
ncbi:Pre-mRNA-splicing factor 3 [Forsythia ovata]|uniref:Pre-mRNA-splicing factor 3 n=1 Tax=Forsythia ovata TaxID=205694 RepID=A0ABD1X7T0_9LAMI